MGKFFQLFFLITLCKIVSGSDYKFVPLETDVGINMVRTICKDHTGFLWIGNQQTGLMRYDGYHIKRYLHSPTDTTSISDGAIFSLYEDTQKTLWVGTTSGLNRYVPEKDEFIRYYFSPKTKTHLSANFINKLVESPDSSLWVLTQHGIGKYNRDIDEFSFFLNTTPNASNNFTCIDWDKEGRLWCGVNDKNGLFLFDTKNNVFKHFDDGKPKAIGDKNLIIDNDNKFWFGHRGVGFARFNPKTKQFNFYPTSNGGSGTMGNLIHDMIEVDSTNLFIGIDQGGINIFNRESGLFKYITDDNQFYGNLSSNGIYCIYKDDEGIIWTGTSRGGVCYCNPKQSRFKTYSPRTKTKKSNKKAGYYPSYGLHSSYYEDDDGKIWIGTDGGGINILDPTTGEFSYIYEVNIDGRLVTLDVIRSITKGGDGLIYITPWEGEIVKYNKKTGKYYPTNFRQPKLMQLNANTYWKMFVDSKKRFWISYTFGTISLHNSKEEWLGQFFVGDSIHYVDVNMQETKDNVICILTRNGIYHYIDSLNKVNKIIDKTNLVSMDLEDDGSIWFASDQDGLFYYNQATKTVKNIDLQFDVHQFLIRGISHSNNKVWISTNHGILIYDIATEHTQSFDKEDGLQGNDFFHQSVLETLDGQIYFGGNNGSTRIDPLNMDVNNVIPPVYITDIHISNKRQELDIRKSILKNNIVFTDSIELDWKSRLAIELEFVGINYTFPYKNEYKYKLEGLDGEWQFSDASSRKAVYTNLAPGNYTFKVKASNNDGVWNEVGKQLTIIIKPPFWHSKGFYGIVVLFLFIVIYLIIIIREQRITRDKKMLQKKVEKRTELILEQKEQLESQNKELAMKQEELQVQNEELNMHRNHLQKMVDDKTKDLLDAKERAELSDKLKSSFLANMSHEIRTPMNAIIGFAGLLSDKNILQEERDQFVSVIVDNSEVLLHLVEDILDFSMIESDQMKIRCVDVNINQLLENIYSTFLIRRKKTTSVEFKLYNELVEMNLNIQSDEYRIRQIITNLISNSFKFTTYGFIELGSRIRDNRIEFYVKDSGIGMSEEEQQIIFQQFVKLNKEMFYNKRGIGLGLSISKRLAVLLGGDLKVKSSVNLGSEFILSLPLKTKQ